MKEVIIRITGKSALSFIAAGTEDLEKHLLPNRLGVDRKDVEVLFN